MGSQPSKNVMSVSQAMEIAKEALESLTLTLMGEVSEVNDKRGYAAAYFTLKDDKATMPCMMWKNRYEKQGTRLSVGMLVKVTGRFTLYAPKGRMSFEVFSLAPAGEGELRQRVANLARKLAAEGLTADERKRAIPKYCERIGLVTSPRGAAVHDVLRTLRRRFPLARVLFAGVPVEGVEAPQQLTQALATVADAGAEVILLVRGGGSFEDLMPFNDEGLARAIAASPVPVVTGIGHEPDTSIADMVADLRASTPTAAAEAISPKRENLQQGFDNASRRMAMALKRQLSGCRMELEAWAGRPTMRDSHALLATDAQRLDGYADKLGGTARTLLPFRRQQGEGLSGRLSLAIPQNLTVDQAALSSYRTRLQSCGRSLLHDPYRQTAGVRAAMDRAMADRLDTAGRQTARLSLELRGEGRSMLSASESAFRLAASRLEDLSPLAVIKRGYAIARDTENRVVDSVSNVSVGQRIAITVADGRMDCTVDSIDQTEIVLIENEE